MDLFGVYWREPEASLRTGGTLRDTLLRALVTLFILTVASDQGHAQDTNTIHPDWTGFYRLATTRDLAGSGFKQDAPGEQLNGLITPYLQPWAKARMEATDGVADDTGQVCLPDGIFSLSEHGRDIFLLASGARPNSCWSSATSTRPGSKRIYMDRAAHPKNPTPTWNGDSIGRWEGDALVVDTVGFNDKSWLFGGKQPHTEASAPDPAHPACGQRICLEMTHHRSRIGTRSHPLIPISVTYKKQSSRTRCRRTFAVTGRRHV